MGALVGDPENRGISIEIWLRAFEETKWGVPNLLSFVDDSGKVVLLAGQWRSSLILRWPEPGCDVRKKWKEIGLKDALTKGVSRLITVASDEKGTAIYLDGLLARAIPNLNLNDVAPGMANCGIVLGNSPSGKSSWSGDVFGLAFYKASLSESEALESFQHWMNGRKKEKTYGNQLVTLYRFDEGTGNQVQNTVGGAGPLIIPDHLKFHREALAQPVINNYNKLAYMKDALINILGFIPLGFLLPLWLIQVRLWLPRKAYILTAFAGVVISLFIESVQVFLPQRDSSFLDLCSNTIGTVLGVMGARKLEAGRLEGYEARSSKMKAQS